MIEIKDFYTVSYGGISKNELLEELARYSVELNSYAKELFASDLFKISSEKKLAKLVKWSVGELGFDEGATISKIQERARKIGLNNCPLEIAPHFRLQYLNQPEALVNELKIKNKPPEGAIKIMSSPLKDDYRFPKGFYIIHVDGINWLRGFICDNEFIHDNSVEFVFERNNK